MGEYRLPNGIRNFTPDNTETTLYVESRSYITISDLLALARNHFGCGTDANALRIESEKIHTRCLGYDAHDGGDWDDYIVLTKEA